MSKKGFAPIIAIIIIGVFVIGTGLFVYQSSKTRNKAITDLTSITTTTLPTTTITITTSTSETITILNPPLYISGDFKTDAYCRTATNEPQFRREGWYLYDGRNTNEAHPDAIIYFLKLDICVDNCNAVCGADGHSIINSCDSSLIFSSNSITCTPKSNLTAPMVSDVPADTSSGSCITLCKAKEYNYGYCDEWSPNIEYPIPHPEGCATNLKGLDIGWTSDCRIVSLGSKMTGIISPDPQGREWKATCCCTNNVGG